MADRDRIGSPEHSADRRPQAHSARRVVIAAPLSDNPPKSYLPVLWILLKPSAGHRNSCVNEIRRRGDRRESSSEWAGVRSAAFGPGNFAKRGLAQSLARDLGPKDIHVAWIRVDSAIELILPDEDPARSVKGRPSASGWARNQPARTERTLARQSDLVISSDRPLRSMLRELPDR